MRRYFDVTLPYTPSLPTWPNSPKPEVSRVRDMSRGAHNNVSRIAASVHHGTHVDAPIHFIADGAGVDALPVATLIGKVFVAELIDVDLITAAALDSVSLPAGCERVMFKTRNSELWNDPGHEFRTDFVAVAPDAAQALVDRGMRLIGVDYLSVEPFDTEDYATHHTLLGAGVVIVEGLDLRAVAPGEYEMACLPINIVGADGAPARVVLWTES